MRRSCGPAVRFVCLLLFGTAPLLHAQSTSVEPATTETALRNPGDLRSSVGVRTEYQNLKDGGYRFIVTPRFQYAVDPDLAFRLETPYLTLDPGAEWERSSKWSDLRARVAWRSVRRADYSVFLATDLIFDTRNDIRLGSGKTIIAPNVYASIDLPAIDSVFFPYVQHYASLAGGTDGQKVSFTTLKPDSLTIWSKGVYTVFDPSFTVDWQRNAKVGLTLEMEIGKFLPSGIVTWIRPGIGLINRNDLPSVYNWNLEVGARYLF